MNKRYSTGFLIYPSATDASSDDLEESLTLASQDSMNDSLSQPRAVWNNETGEVIYIVYEGTIYQP